MTILGLRQALDEKQKPVQDIGSKKLSDAILPIGEVVRQFDITARSLHFYEQRGMLTSIRQSGARCYDKIQIERLRAILKGKSLGFTLTEIEGFLQNGQGSEKDGALAFNDKAIIRSQLKYLEQRRAEIDLAIAELSASLEDAQVEA